MPWLYIDDHWDEHPKLVAAYEIDPQAIALFFASLAYCRRNDTDGLVMGPKVRGLLGWRPKSQKALQAIVLWEPVTGTNSIVVHDWSQWNKTSTEKSASARNAAQVRWARERDAGRIA